MPVTLCPPDSLEHRIAQLESAGNTVTNVQQLHDGRLVLIYQRRDAWPPAAEHRNASIDVR